MVWAWSSRHRTNIAVSIFSRACLQRGGKVDWGSVVGGVRSYLFSSLEIRSSRSPAHWSRSNVVRKDRGCEGGVGGVDRIHSSLA